MGDRFNITRVALRNYRSIAECEVALGPLTVLVGPNGSGKSNFLDALQLTSDALSGSLDAAMRDRGGVREVRRARSTRFGVALSFAADGLSGHYSFQVATDGLVVDERLDVTSAGGHHYFHVDRKHLVETSEPVAPPVARDRLYLVSASGLTPFRRAFDGLSAIAVYHVDPDAIRRPQTPDPGQPLRRDGSNIASVLDRLAPATKKRIEEYLSRIVPGVTGVRRNSYGPYEGIEFTQLVGEDAAWQFSARAMSEGTLHALGILVALFSGDTELASPIGIEEPELALHPAAAGVLLEALRDAADTRQVLITTHSPDLLDSPELSADEILAVRSAVGRTRIGPVDRAGRQALHEHLFTAGELLRVDQLTPATEPSSDTLS